MNAFRLDVLNPHGNDACQAFTDHAGPVDDRIHAPVNHHAYAACTGGMFHKRIHTIPENQKAVLLLIRWDLKLTLKILRQLKAAGKTVVVALKEAGTFQIAELFVTLGKFELFRTICLEADGCLATTFEVETFYKSVTNKQVAFIPTPYPVEDERWCFSIPHEERRGVFVGTREFEIPSRNHLMALLALRELTNEPITVINVEDRPGRKFLAGLDFPKDQLRVIEGPVPYSQYLKLMAKHRLVFQFDRSTVPGQVAGDALLCRIPCVGGDGTIERLVFPDVCGFGRDFSRLIDIARMLLENPAACQTTVSDSEKLAAEKIGFPVIARTLEQFFDSL